MHGWAGWQQALLLAALHARGAAGGCSLTVCIGIGSSSRSRALRCCCHCVQQSVGWSSFHSCHFFFISDFTWGETPMAFPWQCPSQHEQSTHPHEPKLKLLRSRAPAQNQSHVPPCWQSSTARPPGTPMETKMAVSPLGWGLCAAFGAVPKSVPSAGTPTAHMGWVEGAVLVPKLGHHRGRRKGERAPNSYGPGQGWVVAPPHLEGVEEESEEDLDVAQDARGLLIGGKDEDDFMDPKEGDECQRGFGQPERGQGFPWARQPAGSSSYWSSGFSCNEAQDGGSSTGCPAAPAHRSL